MVRGSARHVEGSDLVDTAIGLCVAALGGLVLLVRKRFPSVPVSDYYVGGAYALILIGAAVVVSPLWT